jgi:hypothetical protein
VSTESHDALRSRLIQPFNKETLLTELEELSRRLAQRNLRASIYIAGGAAMILAHRSSRVTFDIDVLFVDGHTTVSSIAEEMAKQRNLAANWLNNTMRLFMEHPPPFDTRAKTVFNAPHLVVTGASPEYLAAMKIQAGRRRDIQDIQHLLATSQIQSVQQIIETHAIVFHGREVPPENLQALKAQLAQDPKHTHSTLPDSSNDSNPSR